LNCDFPKIISKLRKQRGISQKQAATSLGISQALLSHYEKGIRECGLDFLIHAADYYGVSCDYLLGCEPEKNDKSTAGQAEVITALQATLNLLSKLGNSSAEREAYSFITLAVFRLLKLIFEAYPIYSKAIFSNGDLSDRMADGYMQLCVAKVLRYSVENKRRTPLTIDYLREKYPNDWSAIVNLIITAEGLLDGTYPDRR